MPRHTHPPAAAKHSRAHTRFQRDRWARRRWAQAKERYDRWSDMHPHDQRANPGADDAWWPFTMPANEFARNPFNRCSCEMCAIRPPARRASKRAERRRLEREAHEDIALAFDLHPEPVTVLSHPQTLEHRRW